MRVATILGPVAIGLDASFDRYVPASRFDQARPPFWRDDEPKNIGDWFITKVTERILDIDELLVIRPDAGQAAFDEVNSTCDAVILKGGNYLHPGGLLRKAVGLDVFRKLEIPLIMFGSGVQAGFDENVQFDDEDIEILRYIHGSCAASSVRGWSAAAALERIGISNTVVTGCPTLFWARQPELRLRPPGDRRAVFTFRDGLFTRDEQFYRNQFVAIDRVRDLFSEVTVALQGEEIALQDLFMARHWGAETGGVVRPDPRIDGLMRRRPVRLDVDALQQAVHERYDRYTRPALVDWVCANSFFSWDIADYLDLYRSVDVIIGCRFHGNLLALANGTPAYYLTYDQRTEELVELLGLPSQRLPELQDDFDPRHADWSVFESRYRMLYERLLAFLDVNGLSHKLPRPSSDAISEELPAHV
jgi:Polysaccharide pyruvyl transferase